ncbi:MAG: ABC transporter permease [Coriobacteriales bacterium]|jgi:ABC-2 type transport system permease protein
MNPITEISNSHYLLFNLVSKDFKLKYRRSALGVLWSVLNPLLTMIVLTAVFSQLFRFRIEYYPLYFILGQTLFGMMNDGTSGGMRSIITSASLIKKVKVDKIIFPVEKVLFALVNYAFSFIAVICVMIYYQIPPSPLMFFLPLIVLYTTVFSMGLSLLLAALATFFRDILHLWSVLLTLWTYCTPLFYPVSILPDWMFKIIQFNPMYHYVEYIRNIMIYNVNPGLMENIVCIGFAAITLIVGYLVFTKTQKKFILYI